MARHINAAIARGQNITGQLPDINDARIGKTVGQAFGNETGRQIKLRHGFGYRGAAINRSVVEAENTIADFTRRRGDAAFKCPVCIEQHDFQIE